MLYIERINCNCKDLDQGQGSCLIRTSVRHFNLAFLPGIFPLDIILGALNSWQ